MAKYIVVSVRDRAAETFGMPYCVPHPGIALRAFSNEVNRVSDQNPLWTNAEDFELYQLGMFDDQSGTYELLLDEKGAQRAQLLAVGKELKRTVN